VKTSRKERKHLLGEMEKVTGLDRKSLIRLLKSPLERKPRTKQRGRTYGADVDAAIGVVSATLHYPCAERLTPNLAWMAAHLATHQELGVSDAMLEQLERISISTEGRRPRTMRPHQARKPFARLCDTGVPSPDVQAQLTALREQTNPRQLLAQIEAQLDYLFSLPCRTPEHTEVVYDTLSEIPDPRPEKESVR